MNNLMASRYWGPEAGNRFPELPRLEANAQRGPAASSCSGAPFLARLAYRNGSVNVPGMFVNMVLVPVALVRVVDVARFVTVMLMGIALVRVMVVEFCVVLVPVALVLAVHVARLIGMVAFVVITLVHIVALHRFLFPRY